MAVCAADIALSPIGVLFAGAVSLVAQPLSAAAAMPITAAQIEPSVSVKATEKRAVEKPCAFAIFTPSSDPVRHQITYDIWEFALKQMVVWMGPSLRKRPYTTQQNAAPGRLRQGDNSRFRNEGSLVAFLRIGRDAITSFTE
ncbi:MAG: hypothetical protein AAF251_06140 [Pseudomonadota bacterium]